MFETFNKDKTHCACICRMCGQLQIKPISENSRKYICSFCCSDLLLITDMKPSEAQREKNAHRWRSVLSRYLSPEEIKNIESQTYANQADVQIERKTDVSSNDEHCIPTCPTCHSKDIEKISNLNRITSMCLWGLFSSKINKQFSCKNCGYKW